jgi:hypothetical protein
MTLASESLLAFTITMNRIVTLRLISFPDRPLAGVHQQDEPDFAAPTDGWKLFPG